MSRPRVYETPPIGTKPWPGLLPLWDLDPNDEEARRAVAYACGKFLVEQGGPSMSAKTPERRMDGRCAYRGSRGTMCAWGVFIPDKDYTPRMEGRGVGGTIDFMPGGVSPAWAEMCLLQLVHDEVAKCKDGPWSARLLSAIDRLLPTSNGPSRHRERIILRAMRDGVHDAVLASPEPTPSTTSTDGASR